MLRDIGDNWTETNVPDPALLSTDRTKCCGIKIILITNEIYYSLFSLFSYSAL